MRSKIKEIKLALKRNIYDSSNHLLTLVDKSPYSKTYGCFDRHYWQYKIKDFPSGMSQEAIFPMFLALKNNIYRNISFKSKKNILEIIENGAKFSLATQNDNGSVDDYFPYEQASGATAFTAYAILGCIEINKKLLKKEFIYLLKKRIEWLAMNSESGKLSNHEALICLVLAKAAKIFKNDFFYFSSLKRLKRLISWRNNEGWFEEYEGLDIGYETLTFSCILNLKKFHKKEKNLLDNLINAEAKVIIDSIEPDGNLGGELYSRGTWNCFAHGILTYAIENKNKKQINKVIKLLESRFLSNPYQVKDDYIIQHHLWSDILTYNILERSSLDEIDNKKDTLYFLGKTTKVKQINFYPNSGHLWIKHGSATTHVSIKMGGLFRLYKNDKFIFQDTQNALKLQRKIYVANTLNNKINFQWINDKELKIEGYMIKSKSELMTSPKLVLLRLVMGTIGRFFPNQIRKLMQRILIESKTTKKRKFSRIFKFSINGLTVYDSYKIFKGEKNFVHSIETSFSTYRHVIMSRIFHPYFLSLTEPNQKRIIIKENNIFIERNWKV